VGDTNRSALAEQYADDRNLAARQSIYRFRRDRTVSLYERTIEFAELRGGEVVVDVGCGNGRYLDALRRRSHQGLCVGLDLSAGMARQAAAFAPAACSDAQRLPLRSAVADVAVCAHMLYHVPDQAAAVAELRRIVRPGGRALVVTNSEEHFRQVGDLVADVLGTRPMRLGMAFKVETGEPVLRTAFDAVERHDAIGALDVTDADAVVAYVASVRAFFGFGDDGLAELGRRVAAIIERDGAFEITTATGVFVCS
jgi:ubiquinone/menaquinone biosynthesis C-methylase UbiE